MFSLSLVKKVAQDLVRLFCYIRAFVLGRVSDQDATNEGGRAERPTEQRKPQLTQAKRAVSKARTDTHEARERREPIEREPPTGRGSSEAKRRAPSKQEGNKRGPPAR